MMSSALPRDPSATRLPARPTGLVTGLAALTALALCALPQVAPAQPTPEAEPEAAAQVEGAAAQAAPTAPLKTYSARLLGLEVEPLNPEGKPWDVKVPKLPMSTELPDLRVTVNVNGVDVLSTPVVKDSLSVTFELDPIVVEAEAIFVFKVWDDDPIKSDLIAELPFKPTAEQSASNEPVTLSSASVKSLSVVFFGGVLPPKSSGAQRVVERAEEAARMATEAAEAARKAAEAAAEAREELEAIEEK